MSRATILAVVIFLILFALLTAVAFGQTAPAGFTLCAQEGGTCTFDGTAQVMYGAGISFITRTLTTPVTCSVGAFGSDPIVGTVKACFVETKAAVTPDGTRVPPAPSIVLPGGLTYSLGNKDAILPGAFEILKNGASMGAVRAGQLALCNGEIYAFSVRDGNWWKIAGTSWVHTITIPCAAVDFSGMNLVPTVAGQTLCTLAILDKFAQNNTIWADTPDCLKMKGATLYKIKTDWINFLCVDSTPPMAFWTQRQIPCRRPSALP